MKDRFSIRRCGILSLLRLNQLGYFEEIKNEDAEVKPSATDSTRRHQPEGQREEPELDRFQRRRQRHRRKFHGAELYDQQFSWSWRESWPHTARRHAAVAVSASLHRALSVRRPISLGFSLYSTSFRYDQAREAFGLNPGSLPQGLGLENRLNFEQKHTGFNLSTSYPLRIFHRLGIDLCSR